MSKKINKNLLFKRIVELLKQNPYGLSSTDLSKILRLNRMTLVKYLVLMQDKGIIEFKSIGMAKVWHTSSKYDLINMITKDEAGSIQALVAGRKIKIRDNMPDTVPLPIFRAVKAALALSKNADKALYEAGQLIAKNCMVHSPLKDPNIIVENLKRAFYYLNLGDLSVVQLNPSIWIFALKESATAHGSTLRGNNLCYFEAGLISGIISNAIGKKAIVRETKCIGTGSMHCEFQVMFTGK